MFKLLKKNINKKLILISFFVLLSIFLLPNLVPAEAFDYGAEKVEPTGLGSVNPIIIAVRIIQIALGFLSVIAVGLLIYGGFLWMTSVGNEAQIDKAKSTIRNAIIGIIIILSALGITMFIISRLIDLTGAIGGSSDGGATPGMGGVGTIGVCVVESVYPEPNQRNVARNTSIIVTFKEEAKPSTVCNVTEATEICDGENIKSENVKIYKSSDDLTEALTEVRVYSTVDKKTFVFVPSFYLGSPSEYIWYTAHFLETVEKWEGTPMFETCDNNLIWQFEVSNRIDLTPPQIKETGLFPPVDNDKDIVGITSSATNAIGKITVNNIPYVYSAASSDTPIAGGGAPSGNVTMVASSELEGVLTIAVLPDEITAEIKKGSTPYGTAIFKNSAFEFENILTLEIPGGEIQAGHFWTVDVLPKRKADTLTLGSDIYSFVNTASLPNHIEVGADNNSTASNIAFVVDEYPDLIASSTGNVVNIQALVGGQGGNSIVLQSSNTDLNIVPMAGGQDRSESVSINDKKDQPMNSVIQINFNEAILPINVSGNADDIHDYIRVMNNDLAAGNAGDSCVLNADCVSFNCVNSICDGTNNYLPGEFRMSNLYRTIEFISDNQCGVNGCGEPIYCLPENSNLRVEIHASDLVTCVVDDDCKSKSPYIICSGNCQDADGTNHPIADIGLMNGVMDTAINSFDGNRDGKADGPVSFFNENLIASLGKDKFLWSFFINDKMETTPPSIELTTPNINGSGGLIEPVEAIFSKLMMSSSLKTGSVSSRVGPEIVNHKGVNVWNLFNKSIGYWLTNEALDVNLDGTSDKTKLFINHTLFDESAGYRAQIGSATKDIYQNCFKPSDGPACSGDPVSEIKPSCCNSFSTDTLGSDGNCQ